MASTTTAAVSNSGTMRRLRRGRAGAARAAAGGMTSVAVASRFASVSTLAISLAPDNKSDRGKNDDIDAQHEECRVPNMIKQPKACSGSTQCDRHDPGRDKHDRNRGDVDPEQVDLGKPHAPASNSK